MKIRMLTKEDWQTWKQFRLTALQDSPESFGSSYEEELKSPDSSFQDSLTINNIFGAYIDNVFVGSACFRKLNSLKTQHRVIVWGMYVQPEYRRKGVANSLIKAVINHAKPCGVMQLHLTCVTTNLGAIKFYQNHGFEIYGTEPRALKIGDKYFDEHLMVLDLMATREKMNSL